MPSERGISLSVMRLRLSHSFSAPAIADEIDRQKRTTISVFVYHRSLVLDALGETEAADKDREWLRRILPDYRGEVLH